MTSSDPTPSSILVDVELPSPAPLSPVLVDLLSALRVVLVGWYAVPEQTSPAQARDQFGASARDALARIATPFEAAGAQVDTRLVFTGDRLDTLGRISAEEGCDAVLIPADLAQLRRLLVPLRGLQNLSRIAALVADLVRNRVAAGEEGPAITLLHILEDEEGASASEERVLRPAASRMTARGVPDEALQFRSVEAEDPARAIVRASTEHDAVILGETEPTVREVLFGSVPENIVEEAKVPVIVVRHERETVGPAERAARANKS